MNSYRQGKSYLRQYYANRQRETLCVNHPSTYGWEVAHTSQASGLTVYRQGEWLLTPNGKGTGWIYWQPEGKPEEKLGHIQCVTDQIFKKEATQ